MTYKCDCCVFYTTNKTDYIRHMSTKKHIINACQQHVNQYMCSNCDKSFKDRSGLWRHRKKCMEYDDSNTDTNKELMMMLIKDNAELKNMLINVLEQPNVTNINCNNKTFNLNVYLNETCKDAINLSDFVSSINMTLDDLELTGKKGYVEGISSIFIRNLNTLEHHLRPIHCSDYKREVIYIKDNNKWEKDGDDKPKLTNAIKAVAYKNIKQIADWKNKYPDCNQSTSRRNDLYLKIVSNSMNGFTEEEDNRNINKIISNLAKQVIIDKHHF